jgi:hypothetical protein
MIAEIYGVPTAKQLLRATDHNRTVAWDELQKSQGHFHLVMEYFVVQNRYRPLFTDDEAREAELQACMVSRRACR